MFRMDHMLNSVGGSIPSICNSVSRILHIDNAEISDSIKLQRNFQEFVWHVLTDACDPTIPIIVIRFYLKPNVQIRTFMSEFIPTLQNPKHLFKYNNYFYIINTIENLKNIRSNVSIATGDLNKYTINIEHKTYIPPRYEMTYFNVAYDINYTISDQDSDSDSDGYLKFMKSLNSPSTKSSSCITTTNTNKCKF